MLAGKLEQAKQFRRGRGVQQITAQCWLAVNGRQRMVPPTFCGGGLTAASDCSVPDSGQQRTFLSMLLGGLTAFFERHSAGWRSAEQVLALVTGRF